MHLTCDNCGAPFFMKVSRRSDRGDSMITYKPNGFVRSFAYSSLSPYGSAYANYFGYLTMKALCRACLDAQIILDNLL